MGWLRSDFSTVLFVAKRFHGICTGRPENVDARGHQRHENDAEARQSKYPPGKRNMGGEILKPVVHRPPR